MRQKIRIWLRNFFGFSRTETNGFIILLLLMVFILSMPFLSKTFYSYYEKPLLSKSDKSNLNSLLSELENNVEFHKEKKNVKRYQHFDLNKSTAKHLQKSGFPEYLAERIVKYREKVKPFESKDDLLKIYGVDSTFYREIHPYIKVSKIQKEPDLKLEKQNAQISKSKHPNNIEKDNKKPKLVRFNLNKVDSTQLQEIYGIGPAYSKRIVKYREYLGGFHSLKQLKEVYGLKKENLDTLKKHVFLSNELIIKKLKVNQLNAESLIQHPYISYKEANLIVNYRNQHGKYNSFEDVLAIKVLDSSWVKKIAPYFTFD